MDIPVCPCWDIELILLLWTLRVDVASGVQFARGIVGNWGKTPLSLGHIGDYATQFFGDYNQPS